MNNPETYHNKLSRRRAIGLLGLGMGAIQFPMGCTKDKSMKDSVKSEPIHYMTDRVTQTGPCDWLVWRLLLCG